MNLVKARRSVAAGRYSYLPLASFLTAAVLVFPQRTIAQPPPLVWFGQVCNYGLFPFEGGIAVDANDNLYVASEWIGRQPTPVPPLTIGNWTLTSTGFVSAFLAKFSKTGTPLWALPISGGPEFSQDFAAGCATDTNGDAFITGSFSSTNLVLGSTVLTNPAGPDVPHCFVAKCDPQGNYLWAAQSYGDVSETGTSVAVDSAGNVWLAGIFASSNVFFGTNELINADPSSNDYPNFQTFVVKYSAAGDVLWARAVTTHSYDVSLEGPPPAIAMDTNGNAYLLDAFLGVADAGTNLVTNSTGEFAALLAKFDSLGNVLWAEQAGYVNNGGELDLLSLAVDSKGNCVFSGTYLGSQLVFPTNSLPVPLVHQSAYLAKFDANGNYLWSAAPPEPVASSVAVDAIGNIYCVGSDFAIKYAGNGSVLWSTNSSGFVGYAQCAAAPAGNLFLVTGSNAGEFSGPTLAIQPMANQVLISWPTNESGMNLESAPSVSGPWSPVTNAPAIIGNQFIVTNAASPGAIYFQLGNY